MSNKIVGEITNVVGFQTDKRSYEQVKADMQKLTTTWNRCADKMRSPSLEKMKQVSRELKRQRDLVKEIQRIQAATKNPVTTPSRTPRTAPTRQPKQPRRPLGLPVGGKALKVKSIIGRAGEESRPALTMEQAAKGLAIARQRLALSEIQKRNAKREGDYQRMMITSASQLSRIQKADVALRYEAIRAMQKQLALEKAGKTTRNQTRMLQAKYVRDLRRNARMRSNSRKAGRINTSPEAMGPKVLGMPAGAAINGAAIAAIGVSAISSGLQKGFETIRDSTQRQGDRDLLQKGYGISDIEFRAVQQAVREGSGYNLSAEKYNDMNKDLREKAGESLQGEWKKDKKTGEWRLSGGGELGSNLLTAVANKEGIKKAKAMQRALQDMTTVEFVQMLKNMEKSGKYTANEVRFFAEAINDVSLLLPGSEDIIMRTNQAMEQIIASGTYLTEEEQKSIRQLQGLEAAFEQSSNYLKDKFTSTVGETLEQYGVNQKAVSDAMKELQPFITDVAKGFSTLVNNVLWCIEMFGKGYKALKDMIPKWMLPEEEPKHAPGDLQFVGEENIPGPIGWMIKHTKRLRELNEQAYNQNLLPQPQLTAPQPNIPLARPMPQSPVPVTASGGGNQTLHVKTDGEMDAKVHVTVDVQNNKTFIDQIVEAKIKDQEQRDVNMFASYGGHG